MHPMNSDTAKRSRGRPRGSTSFIKVRLSDLNEHLGSDTPISVSKKWMIDIGMIADEAAAPIEMLHPSQPEEPKIQFTIK